jgi:hypothetical protein
VVPRRALQRGMLRVGVAPIRGKSDEAIVVALCTSMPTMQRRINEVVDDISPQASLSWGLSIRDIERREVSGAGFRLPGIGSSRQAQLPDSVR